MAIRISGLNSGLDTDSIVQELVSAYRTKQDKYTKAQTKLSWKQDAWKDMNTKIYNFYSKTLSNMRRIGNFTNKKKTTVSDSTKATVTASSSVTNGTQTLKVNKLAKAGYLTGKKLELGSGEKIEKSTTLAELGISDGTLQLKVGGETKSVEVKAGMTVSDFTKALNEQGVSANFDTTQQRFFIQSADTGTSNDFSFVVNEGDKASFNILNNLGLATAENYDAVAGDYASASNGSIIGSGKFASMSNQISDNTQVKGLGIQSGTMKFMVNGAEKTVAVDADTMTVKDLKDAFTAAGMNLQYNSGAGAFVLSSTNPGESVELVANKDADGQESFNVANSLGLATKKAYEAAGVDASNNSDMTFASQVKAQNAEIELNGAVFEGESNKFSINGLNITATGVTTEEMTITTATDVDGIYDMVKGFLKEYSELMNAMEKAYNAPTSKGYEPLTDDEKESMSDKEVEKWETKIKDSILRRDDTLRGVMSGMSSNMAKVFEINGKNYSLASFGIKTAGYFNAAENESYAYHIDGDPDDSVSSSNEDKLRAMIEEDPDAVGSFFTQLATSVYDNLHEKMGTTTLSSVYKVYNDKQMKSEYDEYTKTIKKWEDKLKDMEDYYYKKFSAMETALAKLQSQTNSLSSLLGG